MAEQEITDEEAIEHFKRRVLAEASPEEVEKLEVVIEDLVYPFKEILAHMEARDEIGRREIEVEKAYMRALRRRGLE